MHLVKTINTKLKDNLQFRIGLILGSILLIAIREPALLLYPRLWGEEGTVFYSFALHHSIFEIFTTVHVGYLTVFNSIVSTLQAKVFCVENVPIISTYMGFLVQLIPIYIVGFTKHEFWDTPLKKMTFVFIIVLITSPELVLNTTNSHFVFGLVTFLIMVISTIGLPTPQKYFFRFLLLIGSLSGPASLFFTPIFWLKAYQEKRKEKYIQASILTFSAIVQSAIIIYSVLFDNKYRRLSGRSLEKTIRAFFTDNFSLSIHVGPDSFFFGIVVAIFFIFLLINNKKMNEYKIFMLSFLLISFFSTLGSIDMAGSPRYAFIPTCILMMIIISKYFNTDISNIKLSYTVSLILIACLFANLVYYKQGMETVYESNYPKWDSEVAKWRKDKTYNPQVHPGFYGLEVKL